jgi:hypothetical protein
MRILIAGVVGGVVMFIWATIAHLATPLASAGLKPMPNEAATISTLHAALGDTPGLYFFPAIAGSDSKAMKDQQAKMQLGPSGLLAYRPPGAAGVSLRQLLTEFALEVVESLLAAFAISVAAGVARRLGVVVAIGLVAALSTNFSYWNWYGFSWDYTLANVVTELLKYVFAGLAIIAVLAWFGRRGGMRA